MANIREVIDGLEHCLKGSKGCQTQCPYGFDYGCRSKLMEDALEVLKRQIDGGQNGKDG